MEQTQNLTTEELKKRIANLQNWDCKAAKWSIQEYKEELKKREAKKSFSIQSFLSNNDRQMLSQGIISHKITISTIGVSQ